MVKLKKEFKDFHNEIMSTYSSTLRDKKKMFEDEIKSKFPGVLEESGIEINKSDISFFLQGSYANDTAVISDDKGIDLDLAIAIPLNILENEDCRKVKGYLRDSIVRNNRPVEYKKPCLTVTYHSEGEESFHIDFPLYAIDSEEKYYLANGKEYSEEYEWQLCDPKGLNNIFKNSMKDSPQLRRIVRYLKKWKSNVFEDTNEMPPSIAMCIYACENYEAKTAGDVDDDLQALYHIVKKIKDLLSGDDDAPYFEVLLPSEPYLDTMSKINSNKEHRKKFKRKVMNFELQLRNAINASDDHTAAKYIQSVLGEEFIIPEKVVDASESRPARTAQFG